MLSLLSSHTMWFLSFILAELCWLFMCLHFHIAINRFTRYVIRLRRSFYSISIALIIILSFFPFLPFLGRRDELFCLLSLFAAFFLFFAFNNGFKVANVLLSYARVLLVHCSHGVRPSSRLQNFPLTGIVTIKAIAHSWNIDIEF